MSDNSNQTSVQKPGSGKLMASIVSAGIALHVSSYVKGHYNVVLSEEDFNLLQMSVIGFFVWLTPQNIVGLIKGLIMDWKDIVKTWKQPPSQ